MGRGIKVLMETHANENLKYRLANKIRKVKSMLNGKDFELKNIFKKHITETTGKYIVFRSSEEKLQQKVKDIGFDFRTTNEVRKATAFEKNYQEYVDFYNVHKQRPTKNTNGKATNWYFSSLRKYQEGKLSSDLSEKFEKIMEL